MVVMLCSLVDNYSRSEGTCCLHHHCSRMSPVIKAVIQKWEEEGLGLRVNHWEQCVSITVFMF
jgi:hypothetical protein